MVYIWILIKACSISTLEFEALLIHSFEFGTDSQDKAFPKDGLTQH